MFEILVTHYDVCGAFADGKGDRIGAGLLPFWFGGRSVGCGHGADVYWFGGQLGEGYCGLSWVVAVFLLGFGSGGGPCYPDLFALVAAVFEFVNEQVA